MSNGAAAQLYVMPLLLLPKRRLLSLRVGPTRSMENDDYRFYSCCTSTATSCKLNRGSTLVEIHRVSQYKHFRKLGKEYLSNLISNGKYPDIDLKWIGRLLGIYRKGTMVFENENEPSVLMDFAIAEKLYNGKSLIDREIESIQDLDTDRRALLDGFRAGYSSLFQVMSCSPMEAAIRLHDLIRDGEIEITDINFSQSMTKPYLLFTRLVVMKDFTMTSGACFIFKDDLQDILLRRYRARLRTQFVIDQSITRFIMFHKMNLQLGEKLRLV